MRKQSSPLQDLILANRTAGKVLWAVAKDTSTGKLSQLGTPKIIVWAYSLAFLAYVWLFVWVFVITVMRLVARDASGLDYSTLYLFIATGIALPFVLYALRRVGLAAWGKNTRRVTGVMLLSIAACIGPIFTPWALYGVTPKYCTQYLESFSADGAFHPSQQLTQADCFETDVQPLNKREERVCATYMDQTAPNTLTPRPEVCAAGTTPPSRSASTPQTVN